MRNYIFFTLIVFVFGFTSCSDNDSTNVEEVSWLDANEVKNGTWDITKKVHLGVMGDTETKISGTLVLRKDGTFTMYGNVINEFISNYGDLVLSEISGTYVFSQDNIGSPLGVLNFIIDDKYRNNKIWANVWDLSTRVYEDNGLTMSLTHDYNTGSGSMKVYDTWYFKKK